MTRVAREKKLFSFYKISQNCMSGIEIFKNDEDRKILVNAFLKAKEKHNFNLFGIAIYTSGYEMIIYDNGSDLSKIMKSINISFAMKFKCNHENCGVVFKERYKSEVIPKHKLNEELMNLPYCKYLEQSWIDDLNIETCKKEECIDSLFKAKTSITQMLDDFELSYEGMLKNKNIRNELIKTIRKKSTLSLVELGNLFGGLSESTISKILSR